MGLPVLPAFSGPPEITNLINYLNTLTQQSIPGLLAQPQTVMGPNLYNWNPQNLKNFRKAIANVRLGVQNAKLAIVGDSISAGTGGGGTPAKYRVNSWPTKLAAYMQAATGITWNADNVFGTANLTISAYCDKLVLSGGATQGAVNTTLGGAQFQLTGAGNTVAFTPTLSADTFDVYSMKTGGTGTFNINLDGGATLASPTGTIPGGGLAKTSVTGTLGAHTLNCVQSAGTCYVIGIDAYNSAVKQVSVWNISASGALSSNVADATNGYSAKPALAFYAPDCTILCLGINDWNNAAGPATYYANMDAIIQTALLSGDVILMAPNPSSNALTPLATQQQYVNQLYSLANKYSLPLIDLFARFGSYEQMNPLGYYFDNVHPNNIGYADHAGFFSAAFRGLF